MKTLIVCHSKFGNTRAIANAIAEALKSAGNVELISFDQLDEVSFINTDLVVMGCPNHRMNLPRELHLVFEALPHRILQKTPAAVFDTSYKMSSLLASFSAAYKLASKVRRLGGKLVLPPETFFVIEKQGPLYDGEIERAKDWATEILALAGDSMNSEKI